MPAHHWSDLRVWNLPPIIWRVSLMNRMTWKPVYDLVRRIPRGRVLTYGGLARALRLRGGARAAGRAMAASPSGQGIPWHRVVGAGGLILIREPHASLQRRLLESEGIVVDGRRVNLARYSWVPDRRKPVKSREARA